MPDDLTPENLAELRRLAERDRTGRRIRYLRKVDGTVVCRDDGQPVTNLGAHIAQWHSLSPRPNPQGEPVDMQSATVIYSDWTPPQTRGYALGPWDAS